MLENQFRGHVFQRALELAKIIRTLTSGIVYQGPFKGLYLQPDYLWGDGDLSSKLLGLYESQLHYVIEEIINSKPDCVLNIGCAEGYYGLGLAKRLNCTSHLIDIDDRYGKIVNKTAEMNGIKNFTFHNQSNIEYFRILIKEKENPFIFMDCEGAEINFLNLEFFPELLEAKILVETHDFNVNNCTNIIKERFSDTHDIQEIHSSPKNMNLDIIYNFSDLDKMVLWNEWRPCEMAWLYMIPKK
jgi:hypothetical protein